MHNLALTIASPLETTYFSFFTYNPAAQRGWGGGQCLTALNIFYDGAYAFFHCVKWPQKQKKPV